MDIEAVIKSAKLGRARKDAQVDTCSVFVAALYDLLSGVVPCKMITVVNRSFVSWAHSVVEVNGRYFDSMGEFSSDIYRARAKIHPTVNLKLSFEADTREECYESEFDELHAFYLKALTKASRMLASTAKASTVE